jgi:putative sterol carrier protein
VRVADGRAAARPSGTHEPAVTMRTRLPTFIRLAAREINPARAMLEGELQISGDFEVAGRLNEMFGGESQW